MIKTDTEILAEYGIDLYKTDDHFNGQLLQAMHDFASQESKIAVDDFKEKLIHAIRIDLSIKIGDADKLIDLIKKTLNL